ncbi:glycosyltransferase involved in cell wall biosynthesis [Arcicella aurantiaca]|uniref:Glycosyltransferase involved in cell wall biosynthesis n=1 Tax=Arcicella aurantiaca TaxID=591202 RepID=A0A316DW96_9BACT|nr:glycosyltransferase family 2 protein [Arcicella aurantiaca]PWK22637.1 glycosyltransferase involved in cell wall biosynthesis [Arcicella aurantiaca]
MTKQRAKILVIIPCYNEEASIQNLVNDIQSVKKQHDLPIDILVVNDCSKDNTLQVIKSLDCLYLDLPVNLGIGGGMQSGYKYAYRNGYQFAVQMDGDGQHPAIELPKLLQEAQTNKADVIIGSRFLEGKGFQSSFFRRLGITYFKWLNKFLIGQTIHDSTSGFRVFNRKTLELVNQYYPDEYPEPEAIVLFGMRKLIMKEVPVEMCERQGGVSSINSFRAIYYMFKVSLGIIFVYIRLKGKWKM